MVAFAVYDPDTGRVLRGGTMADEASALAQANAGEAIHFGQVPPRHYVGDDGLVDMGEPPTLHHTFDWGAHAWKDLRTIEEIRAVRWAEVKAQRDLLEASGFPYLGKRLDSDARSVQRINTAVQAAQAALAAGVAFPIVWTCADNSLLPLDAAGVVGMPVALATYADQLHQAAKALRAQIEAATTFAEVQAVAWPTTTLQEQLHV
jgi:hypothetical protein